MSKLTFNGSVWCNVDIALRSVDSIYKREINRLGLAVVEWYVLRTLYEQDGQMASRLAEAVGRPATSFTPILDKIQSKGLIERQQHTSDRRALKIHLTQKGQDLKEEILASADRIEDKIKKHFSEKDRQAYESVVANLQIMTL